MGGSNHGSQGRRAMRDPPNEGDEAALGMSALEVVAVSEVKATTISANTAKVEVSADEEKAPLPPSLSEEGTSEEKSSAEEKAEEEGGEDEEEKSSSEEKAAAEKEGEEEDE